MKARVYKSTGSWYTVKGEDGNFYNARIKGIFKIDAISSTNPIAVGDEVDIDIEAVQEESAVITAIADRRNYVARVSPHNKRQHHIVASNLDQSILFATLKEPRTSQGFMDRFLVSCEAYHIPAIIVFNKSDIYRKKELERFQEYKQMYEAIGYQVVLASVLKKEGIEEAKALLKDKTTLLSGHSGVGKSTFINAVFPRFNLRTQEVSSWSGKGMHTTTFAEMFDLDNGGHIIDTPGVREFGLVDITKQELSHYFPEMRALLNECQFNNCMHIEEPGCAVKQEVLSGAVSENRYISYLNILDTMDDKNY
ncbi:ribosome biogenesis GTPase [Hydrobacter penzbergensis]|uniref:Small ribosomal subunit biogenesis GTPase RsgA n=1 Tax=Hydrobacter penzbergensis TaxID=1235997 RepID=A0A8X8IDC7_9BACT|nr:ribosome small subunit-dependent GTPase A [Hydrobacter penzbergensis]MBN8720165.1 ribosome small subunit-dependent GTPase A [Sediminibacterium magnilacihabitans]PQV59964.1 ribosome biogenesis GTPase [Sediminibacterium magnilacihabitans]SDX11446.1 ribosome biogenesis GTPase [Hydrobacter penzbergensis]